MQSHLDAYAAAAARAALDVVQVVGAATSRGDRVLVAQRSGGPYDGCWEFPGGKVEPGESDLSALVREIGEELGTTIVPQAFLGEVVLDGVVGGGPAGASTLRVWWARVSGGVPVAHEHAALRWLRADELDDLHWIPADRTPNPRRPNPPRPPLNQAPPAMVSALTSRRFKCTNRRERRRVFVDVRTAGGCRGGEQLGVGVSEAWVCMACPRELMRSVEGALTPRAAPVTAPTCGILRGVYADPSLPSLTTSLRAVARCTADAGARRVGRAVGRRAVLGRRAPTYARLRDSWWCRRG